MYKKYLNSLSVEDHRRYIKTRNDCNRVIRMSKRKYEIILSEESKTNPKLFWKYVQSKVKSASGISQLKSESGHLSVTNADKANTLNELFSSVFIQEKLNDLPDTVLGEKSNGIILTDLRITPDAVRIRYTFKVE